MQHSGASRLRARAQRRNPLDVAAQKSDPLRSLDDPVHKETLLMRRYLVAALLASLALAACEGPRNNSSWSHKKEGTEIVPSLKAKTVPADTTGADSSAADTSKAHH